MGIFDPLQTNATPKKKLLEKSKYKTAKNKTGFITKVSVMCQQRSQRGSWLVNKLLAAHTHTHRKHSPGKAMAGASN